MSHIQDYILKTLGQYFNQPKLELNDKAEESLSEFVYNSQIILLQVFMQDDDILAFHTNMQNTRKSSIIFYKSSRQDLDAQISSKDINIVTLSNNVAESLYQVVKHVYSPLLASGDDLYSSKLQKNLSDMVSILSVLTHDKENRSNVLSSIADEIEFWRLLGEKRDISKKEKESASSFTTFFEDVLREMRSMESSPLNEAREVVENIGGLLDDVWRYTLLPYPRERMTQIFDIIGHTICVMIQKSLSPLNLWKALGEPSDTTILTHLSEGLKLMEMWSSVCQSLTETYWPNYALHAWTDKPYVPSFCANFQSRLKEVYDIRSTYSQLNKLLNYNERVELKTEQLFEPFENMNVWACSGPNVAWETAISRFSSNLRPAEIKIAEKLRPRFHNVSTKQILYEFMRYKTLVCRPVIKRALNSELEAFVSSLMSTLRTIRSQVDSEDVSDGMFQPPETSLLVQQVQWAKKTEAKVKEIQMCAESDLKDFEGSAELMKMSAQLLKDLKTMYTQLHEEWCRDLQAQLKSGRLAVSAEKPVVEFSSSSQLMVVNFEPRLAWREAEARALAALGLPAPAPAATALHSLDRLLVHARALQQVASFHNTLGERMIPSCRPMMLEAALHLSALVRDQRALYWDDTDQLVNYTDNLKNAVSNIEAQNTYLTSQHVAIRNIVEQLINTELLAKQSEWKKKIKDIVDIIENVESNGYKNTDLWRTHWDWQLYKALECQYIRTLLSLHKHFPHVTVDLVLRGHTVRVQPALEEVRAQHYHQLRRLVALPAHFVGLQRTSFNATAAPVDFGLIVEKHGWLGNKAVVRVEAVLSELERVCGAWTRRAALASVADLDALCAEHLREPQHWEANFKACKAYGQAVAKMTFEDEKIGWITVGTAGLRREFEAQTRNLWASLMSSLQTSCRDDNTDIDAFIASVHVMMENKTLPKNAKQLAEISAQQRALRDKMPEIEMKVEALKRKGHMLRTWGGDASVDGIVREWHRVRDNMNTHQQMFEHQAEIVKSSLNGEWANLNSVVEGWTSRWRQTRARHEDTRATYRDMLDRCQAVFDAQAQCSLYVDERDQLMKECEKFDMKLEINDTWQEMEKMIMEDINNWTVLKEYNDELEKLSSQEWVVFQNKLHLLDEFVSTWRSRLEPYTTLTLFIQQEIDKYTDLTSLLRYLRGSDFTERHWREVFNLLEMEYKKPDTLQLMDFLTVAQNIRKNIKALQKISASASSEAAVRSALNELELWFAGARLTLAYHTDKAKRTTPIVTDYKDLLAKIEEQQWVVSSVDGGSAGSGGDACTAWEARLRQVRRLLRAAHHAQRRWLYLEPILSNDDGELGMKFKKVDQGFRQVSKILESDARLSALLQSARLQSMLDTISEQLQSCQSELNQYIDEKRTVFPRFYFLSDDDLLELLGQARAGAEGREAVMQTHLKKLFPGITGVRLGPGDLSITALCSQFGETFQLDHPIDIDCPVEIWLRNLETEMRSSLKNMTLKCVVTNSLQDQDPFSLPTQILCLAQNIRFTEQAERAISSKELHKLKSNIEKEYTYYGSTEVEDECERHKRQALILQCAYYMTLVKTLIDNNIASTNDWLWQKQLRFYLLNTKEVEAKMGLAQISYSYEYLGVTTGQFVRTELADECFFILTQSLHLGFVGNPFGPAGTGKTESVKALGGLVGRLVLVFNCDEAMDAECMGRFLTGLALCGAWGCFDEFNRLTADTLAAQTHQLAALLDAMQQRKPGTPTTALFNKKQVQVSEWCGVAATLNPAGRGYGGRRELPPALQRLLRPVAMLQPRGEALASHLLAARCVPDARLLATDLNNVFMLASTLLSGERHYDWGLRALKAVVGSLGSAASSATEVNARRAALRRVLTLNNISKLTTHDSQRFQNILSMVFADVPDEETVKDPISSVLESTVKTFGLVHNDLQLQKCLELHEQLQQRMGVVIVGPPGSGKTTIRRLLKSALTQQGKNIVEYTICPKAMSRRALLGHIEQDTRQWTDGVLSTTASDVVSQPADVWCWVVCDGDIDPEWVEALNSVLDDNRLLTLPSGWRIQFAHNVNFLFETHSLEHASPATISRMGIILFSDDVSCASEVLQSWIKNAEFENEFAKMAVPLLEQVATKCMQWFTSHRSDLGVKIYNISLVKQIVTQFEYCVQNKSSSDYSCAEEVVYLAVHNSVSGLIKENAIDNFNREVCEGMGASHVTSVVSEWSDALFLSTRLHSCERALRAVVNSPIAHLLIIGPDACGKNLLAEYVLKESNSTVITVDCTPILEPEDIILELKRNNVVRSGGRGAGKGARVTIYVRSLHRAQIDSWGSCAVHAFLLQLINESGLWARGGGGSGEGGEGGVQWWSTPRVRIVATANSVLTTSRFAAVCSLVLVPEPDDDELVQLIKNYLIQNVGKNIEEKNILAVAGKILAMYKEITETFYSLPHYKWNASHLRSLCENVKWYTPKNMTDLITSLQSEANMIFKDRLVTDDEKNEYNTISKKYLKGGLSEEITFATKLRADGVYMEAVNYKTWSLDAEKLINQCLSEDENVFGEAGAEVCAELALFWPAIAKTTRGGVAACVSGAGAGRRAAARLAAAALPATLLVVDQEQHFNNQLKNAISSSAEGQRTLIVVGEGAVTSRCLGSLEAMRRAVSLPTHLAPAQRSSHTEQNVKENLGIVLCVDKDRDDLWKLFEKYPFLYNEGHVVWVEAWSSQTVREMPRAVVRRLIKENVHEDSNEVLATVPVEGFVSIYNSIESVVKRAPIRYLNFIHAYYHIVCKKKETLLQRRNMLNSGVEALRRARAEVATLQEEAATQEALLSEKQAAANHALDQIGATVRANTDKKDEMHALKKNIELENEKLQIRKKEIEVELASVEPVIAAARSAVGDIRSESLSEIRSLRAPPDVVRDVLEGVLRLMGIADTSWHSMKNFLSKRGVKEDIRCLDASQISAEAAAAVRRLLSSRGASFQESTAKRASAACAPLAAWVRANLHYAEALARVAPLQAQQQQLHKSLREAEEQMAGLSSGLETVEQRVEALKAQLGQHTRDAAALELKLQHAADTLNAARHLLEQLAHEYTTWAHDLQNISKEISELNVRSLLAAAYIVYLPELTEPQAREYLSKWSALIAFEDSSFSVINFLSTPETQLKWDANGLPADDTAVKNAVLIEQFVLGPRCGARPLIVDPEGEALTWLRRTLSTSRCDFLSQHSETLHTALQYAHRLGRVVVVTEIESAMDVEALRCGARLLLHTRDAELAARLQPHCAASLSVLHFTARLDGLTDQLVNYALQQQNPEMNEKSKEIKLQKATLQKQQHELQENVLRELCSNSDILKDSSLLASLEATRATGATIEAALSEASAVEDARCEACVAYRAGARAAAALALSARALYPAALPTDALLDVFADALAHDPSANKSLQTESLNLNHNQIVQYTTKRIIERVLLSVHKKDKHIVALHLLRAVYSDVIKDQLWNIFLGNYDIVDDQNASVDLKKLSPWIKEEFVERIVQIKMTSEDLFNKLSVKDEKLWNEFQNISDASAFSCFKLSGFETVAAAAALRPDILYSVMLTFLETMLGAGALEGSAAVAGAARWAARAMAPPRPILLLAAHGADLLAAQAHSSLNKVGVEAGREAWDACLESARSGGWLALEVGASPLTAQLQHFLQHYADRPVEDFSPDFRLWIVCEDRDIPPLISNLCVNVIVEAGAGVRQNAVSTLCAWGPLEGDERMVRAHVALALLHATVQERRAYIPQGWSRWYAWEWGEVSACGRAVRALTARSGRGGGVDSEALRAISDALYAARVTGAWDRRVLSALVRRTLGEHVYAHAWRPPGCDVRVPYATRLQTCTAALATLPRDDSPALLALPRNCRRTWERAAADRLLAGLRKLESTVSVYRAAEGPTAAKTLPALWKKLMSGCPLLKGDYVVPEPDQRSQVECMWWQRVCADEAREATRTARFIHSAIASMASMASKASKASKASMARRRVHIHQVPEEWQLLWSGPEAPEAYIKEFCFRARAACERLPTNSTHGSLPQEVDLRSFLRPSRVLCALRAQCALALRCAPHALALTVKWESNGVRGEGPALTALTALGLVVCGAEWREGALRAAAPHSPANSPAPPLLLTYALQDQDVESRRQAQESLVVPMYESEARDQLLAESFAPLGADLPPEQALLNSIALVVAPLA